MASTAEPPVDLIVVGGGILGVFHAYHALQRGLSVLLLERHGAPKGATVRNFGQVVPSGLDRQWQAYGRESLAIYNKLQAQGDISVRQNGSVYVASNDEEVTLLEELCQINRNTGYASQLWTAAECRGHLPSLRADYCRAGLFFPEDMSVNPRVLVHRLHQYLAEQSGFTAIFRASVCDVESGDAGAKVRCTDGRVFQAAKVIVCSGHEFKTLFPSLFETSDLEAVKLQMLRLKPTPEVRLPCNVLTGDTIRRYECFAECPSWEVIKSREPSESFGKQWGVHILFKQEVDGSIILGDSHEYRDAAHGDELDFDMRSDINDHFIAEGKKILDLPSWDVDVAWYGIYSQTRCSSGIFTKQVEENIHIVTGIGGKGMTSSAGFARHHLEEVFNDSLSRL